MDVTGSRQLFIWTVHVCHAGLVAVLPSGCVTFCFTDIEGSTSLLTRVGRQVYAAVLEEHRRLLRAVWAAHGGVEMGTEGDSFFVVFSDPGAALDACGAGQRLMRDHQWPPGAAVRVRMGLHTGDAEPDGSGNYTALAVHQAARVAASAHGGQVIVSSATAEVAGDSTGRLKSLGRHRVRDFSAPVELFQVVGDGLEGEFPPLRGVGALEPLAAVVLPTWLVEPTRRPMVGRSSELEVIGTAANDAVVGRRRALLVAGEPGVGKTRLVGEAARAARRQGMLVLSGRCDPDLAAAYGPFTEALRQAAGAIDAETLADSLGRWPGELVRVVPELADVVSGLEPPLSSDPETERWRLFDAVVSAFAALGAAGGLMLVIDDLQWAARPTLALLGHLLRSEVPLPLVVLATYRDTDIDPTHPLVAVLGDLRRIRGVAFLALGGLDVAEMAELVADAAGHDLDSVALAFVSRLGQETGGNPFFAGEIIRHLSETGDLKFTDGRWSLTTRVDSLVLPEGVRAVLRRRLDPLGEQANEVLGVASVAGLEFNLEQVAAVIGDSEEHCLDALERAAGTGLVVELGVDRWRFVHALVRSTLYDGMSSSRRARRHRQIAQILESTPPYDPLALAHHWSVASGADAPLRASEWLRRAGDEAMGRLAPDQAAVFYGRALEIDKEIGFCAFDPLDRVRVTIALGTAQRLTGDAAHRDTLLAAADLANRLDDVELLAEAAVANSRGFFSTVGGVDAERIAVLQDALTRLPAADSRLRARLLATLAAEFLFSPERDRRFLLSDEALAVARREGDDQTLFDVLVTRLLSINTPDTVEVLWSEAQELIPLATDIGDPGRQVMGALAWYAIATYIGQLDGADAIIADADRIAQELGQPTLRWLAAAHRAVRPLLAGRLEEAEAIAGEALGYGQEAGEPDATRWYQTQIATIRRDQGRLDEMIDLHARVVTAMPHLVASRAFLAVAYCELERLDEARVVLQRLAADGFLRSAWDHTWLLGMSLAADACVRVGTTAQAGELYAELLPYAHLHVSASIICLGSVSRSLGVLATATGEYDLAEIHLATAIAENEHLGSPAWASTARLDLAELWLTRSRAGDAPRSQQLIREALDLVKGLGITRLENRVNRILEGLQDI